MCPRGELSTYDTGCDPAIEALHHPLILLVKSMEKSIRSEEDRSNMLTSSIFQLRKLYPCDSDSQMNWKPDAQVIAAQPPHLQMVFVRAPGGPEQVARCGQGKE